MMLDTSDEDGDVSPKSFRTISSTITSPVQSSSFTTNYASSISSTMEGRNIGSSSIYGGSLSSIASTVSTFKSDQNLNCNLDKDSDHHKDREGNLKLYILVARCISFPFAGRRDVDVGKRNDEMISINQFNLLKDKFQAFIAGKLRIVSDETLNTIITMFINTMVNDIGILRRIKSGGWSSADFIFIFTKQIEKYMHDNPLIEANCKNNLTEGWLDKFDAIASGVIKHWGEDPVTQHKKPIETNKEALYDIFQSILCVKKSEHRNFANILQLDNMDEQTAQVRREIEQKTGYTFDDSINKNICKAEMKESIDRLRSCLESVPLNKCNTEKIGLPNIVITRDLEYIKDDLKLKFPIRLIIKEVKGLNSLPHYKQIYCTLNLPGTDKLSTSKTEAVNPCWDTEAEFESTYSFPAIKIKLFVESTSILSLDDRCLAKLTFKPLLHENLQTIILPMKVSPKVNDKNVTMKLVVSYEKPSQIKHFGYLWMKGNNHWKCWGKRFCTILQISQCTFLLCSYNENKNYPNEHLSLRGFIADYKDCSKDTVLGLNDENKFCISLMHNDEEVILGTESEELRMGWVQAFYRATGQTHKPTQIDDYVDKNDKYNSITLEIPNMDDLLLSDYQKLYDELMRHTLHYNLSCAKIFSQGWLSFGQQMVIDEFCTRYSISNLSRVLTHLNFLMNYRGDSDDYDYVCIDPSLIFQLYAIASAYVHGNRPVNFSMNLKSECELFFNLSFDLQRYAEIACINFRLYFPYGRPEGSLKTIISLLERTKRELIFYENNIENTNDVLSKKKKVPTATLR